MYENFNLLVVGQITFDGKKLDVYNSIEEPLFKASDIFKLLNTYIGSRYENISHICEADEIFNLPTEVNGYRKNVVFVNEHGLYNILSNSRNETARKWRRLIHDDLITSRKAKGMSIIQQFDEWDSRLDDLYFDEETGILMQSVTVQGGDVIQVPYKED